MPGTDEALVQDLVLRETEREREPELNLKGQTIKTEKRPLGLKRRNQDGESI